FTDSRSVVTIFLPCICFTCSFFFNDTATTEIYTLSLHDALPISAPKSVAILGNAAGTMARSFGHFYPNTKVDGVELDPKLTELGDRKSTRLNSSHVAISYAVFCLKKKKKNTVNNQATIVRGRPRL